MVRFLGGHSCIFRRVNAQKICTLHDFYMWHQTSTRWWFQICLFSPLLGEMIPFDEYFSNGLKPPTSQTRSVVADFEATYRYQMVSQPGDLAVKAWMWLFLGVFF